jgi:hypothetical protein
LCISFCLFVNVPLCLPSVPLSFFHLMHFFLSVCLCTSLSVIRPSVLCSSQTSFCLFIYLPLCQSFLCPSVFLFVLDISFCLFVYLSLSVICQSVFCLVLAFLSFCLSTSPSVCLSYVLLSFCPYVCLMHLFLSVCLSSPLSVCLSFFLSICLIVCISFRLTVFPSMHPYFCLCENSKRFFNYILYLHKQVKLECWTKVRCNKNEKNEWISPC